MFGWLGMATCCLSRRRLLKLNRTTRNFWKLCAGMAACSVLICMLTTTPSFGQAPSGPVRITLDEAVRMALQHNHNIIAARTAIDQSLAMEVTANLRPNPTLFTDWEYLPLYKPGNGILDYLHDSTEGDIGAGYLFE